jgi:hypothetical protein
LVENQTGWDAQTLYLYNMHKERKRMRKKKETLSV